MARNEKDDPTPGDDDRTEAGSIADRAEGGEQGDLFPEGVLDGDKKTLATVMRKGLPVELVASMMQGEVPLRSGLPDPDKFGRLAVTTEPSTAKLSYVREKQSDGTRKVVGYKIAAQLRPVHIESMGTNAEAVARSFEQLLGEDATLAGRTLDELKERFAEYTRTGLRAV